jgi:threonine/homoserine/homoserine lactone efflux protein
MISIFFEGVLLGLIIAVTLGPAFFTIIQTSIDKGFKYGVIIAIGISLSDITIIALCYLGIYQFIDGLGPKYKLYAGIIASIILIGFGIYTYLKKPDIIKRRSPKIFNKNPKIYKKYTYLLKGYFLNIANPFIIIFWLASMSWVTTQAEQGKLLNYIITFFAGTLITVLGTDLIKSFIANKIKSRLKPRKLLWINRIAGVLLVIFGIGLILKILLKV